jgi:hypothetical protein
MPAECRAIFRVFYRRIEGRLRRAYRGRRIAHPFEAEHFDDASERFVLCANEIFLRHGAVLEYQCARMAAVQTAQAFLFSKTEAGRVFLDYEAADAVATKRFVRFGKDDVRFRKVKIRDVIRLQNPLQLFVSTA